jgi:hypothetical protein
MLRKGAQLATRKMFDQPQRVDNRAVNEINLASSGGIHRGELVRGETPECLSWSCLNRLFVAFQRPVR